MKYKTIGVGNDKIPAIGQGAMGIGGYLKMNNSDDHFYLHRLKCCIDNGISLFDTAEVYGEGHSEYLVGKAIQGQRDKMFISSKVAAEHLHFDDIINSANGSLKRLGTDYIDLYMLHWPNNKIPIVDSMGALSSLKQEGKIRYIGVSNFSLEELKEAQRNCDDRIDAIQLEYNLFERTVEQEILEYCEENNIIMMAYSPLNQGNICEDKRKMRIFQEMSKKYDKTLAQMILNWLISHSPVVAIPTSKNCVHIGENASASDFDLSEEDVYKIGRIFLREKVYVYPEKIRVKDGGKGNRSVYKTVEEARENKLNLTPSPVELAQKMRREKRANPVKVVPIQDETGMYDYDLVEGRLRYWAWVIAFNWKEPVLVNISESSGEE